MVSSNAHFRPFLPFITRKQKRQSSHKVSTAVNVTHEEIGLDPSPPATISFHSCDETSYLHLPDQMDVPPLPHRRDSGSSVFHWGEDRWRSDQIVGDNERTTPTPLFGRRPSFTDSTEGKSLKQDTRKVVNAHLRHLAANLDTRNLVLNKKGSCYFYLDKFLVELEAPKHGGDVTMSTVVYRRLPVRKDESRQEELDSASESSAVSEMDLPAAMSIHTRRNNQIVLCCSQPLASNYENFAHDLNYFVASARKMKTKLKEQPEEQ